MPRSPERRAGKTSSGSRSCPPAQVGARLPALLFHLSPPGRRNADSTPDRFPREVPGPARIRTWPNTIHTQTARPPRSRVAVLVADRRLHRGTQDHGAACAPPPEGAVEQGGRTAASSPKAGYPPNPGSSAARPGAPASTFPSSPALPLPRPAGTLTCADSGLGAPPPPSSARSPHGKNKTKRALVRSGPDGTEPEARPGRGPRPEPPQRYAGGGGAPARSPAGEQRGEGMGPRFLGVG